MNIPQDIAITISKDALKVLDEFNKIDELKNNDKLSEQEYARRIYVEMLKTAQLRLVAGQAMTEGVEFSEDQISFLDDMFSSLSEDIDITNMDGLTKEDVMSVRNFVRKYDNIISTEDLEEDLSLFD